LFISLHNIYHELLLFSATSYFHALAHTSVLCHCIYFWPRVSREVTHAASRRIIVMLELMLNVIVGVNGAPPASYEMIYNIFKIIHVTIV
jgi:hypothetical protein